MLYIRKGFQVANEKYSNEPDAKPVLDYLKLVDQIRKADSDAALINLITMNGFTIEYCPAKFLGNYEVRSNLGVGSFKIKFRGSFFFFFFAGLVSFDFTHECRKLAIEHKSYVKIKTVSST